MVYNDGTDDEPIEFVSFSIPTKHVIGGEVKIVGNKTKEDGLEKYYDYDCDQSNQLNTDVGKEYDARIAIAALILCSISGLIGVATDSIVWLLIAIASFVIMLIFAWLYNREER